jgi:hypothetical protein
MAYHKLNSLYSIAFGDLFREQLVKDGINGYVSEGMFKADDCGIYSTFAARILEVFARIGRRKKRCTQPRLFITHFLALYCIATSFP